MNDYQLAREFELERRYRQYGEINPQALSRAPGNYVLQAQIIQELFGRLGPEVRGALVNSNIVCVRCIDCAETVLVVVYQSEARICHAANLDHLDRLCVTAYELLGVRKFAVRGSDLLWKISRTEEGGWLKHCVEGGVA